MRHLQFVTTTKDKDGGKWSEWQGAGSKEVPCSPRLPYFLGSVAFSGRAQTGKTAIMLDYVWKLLKKIFNCSRRAEGSWATAAVYFRLPGRKVAQDSRNNELCCDKLKIYGRSRNQLPWTGHTWREFMERSGPVRMRDRQRFHCRGKESYTFKGLKKYQVTM